MTAELAHARAALAAFAVGATGKVVLEMGDAA